ncbi:hypothetical protein COY26_02400 [Candidatus Woesearchaeota archaeon CG_4_10_14_0_2_um_filter_33_10]|nr:MAG: hypothetical protein AUJ83_04895 [Candidatus Woesearchaeota archaeon CG1_02_33_12]PIU72898.1 MAG: hypothetical protein COS79_00675 [Candidatus Woesearchaeota archaeon CG06_land_8_20_14_3_00_33_13]PIZ53257.1 MAG: hypothetical protein COY26_02400 [Candidatus Woesearchaeota archaeon CG_4_10_14_0_2_um_filter_33_10]
MILPTKRLSSKRALIGIGAEILEMLDEPKTISRIWDEMNEYKKCNYKYDWFILGINLLYLLDAINYKNGQIGMNKNDS